MIKKNSKNVVKTILTYLCQLIQPLLGLTPNKENLEKIDHLKKIYSQEDFDILKKNLRQEILQEISEHDNIEKLSTKEIEQIKMSLKEDVRRELRSEVEKNFDFKFAHIFQKETNESWNLLIRNAKDGGANTIIAAHVLAKTILDLKKSNESVAELSKSVEKVSSTLKELTQFSISIQALAFQSKMISFNASVEAARAGIHGKVFSIVADSIGLLSKQINDLTTQVKGLLEEIDERMNESGVLCDKVERYFININSELVTFNKLMVKNEELSTSQSSSFDKFVQQIQNKVN